MISQNDVRATPNNHPARLQDIQAKIHQMPVILRLLQAMQRFEAIQPLRPVHLRLFVQTCQQFGINAGAGGNRIQQLPVITRHTQRIGHAFGNIPSTTAIVMRNRHHWLALQRATTGQFGFDQYLQRIVNIFGHDNSLQTSMWRNGR